MKDVANDEMLRGAVSRLRSGDVRMEQSTMSNVIVLCSESIAAWGEPPELKHLSRARKRNQPRFRQ